MTFPEFPPHPPVQETPLQGVVVNDVWCQGVVLVYGNPSLRFFSVLQGLFGEDACLSLTLAAKFHATFVIVENEDLEEELVNRFAPEPRPGCGVDEWYNSGWTGLSSKYMAFVLTNYHVCRRDSTIFFPMDVDDFSRCCRFLRCVPEARGRMHLLKEKGEEWSNLVDRWREIEDLMIEGNRERANQEIRKCIDP